MEYAWRFGVARTPLSADFVHHLQDIQHHQAEDEERPPTSNTAETSLHRSNSSPGTPLTKRRGLFGHSRSASTNDRFKARDRELLFEAKDDDRRSTDGVVADSTANSWYSRRPPLVLPLVGGSGLVGRRQEKKTRRLEKWTPRMPASGANRYYQNKQLPATPRFDNNTDEPSSALADSAITSSLSVPTPSRGGAHRHSHPTALALASQQHGAMPSASLLKTPSASVSVTTPNASFSRAESVSSTSGQTSTRTMQSSDHAGSLATHPSTTSAAPGRGAFVVRNGRSFVADPTLPYPLPVDLAELHRQSLRTLLLFQLFGGPVCSPAFEDRPPLRVLEIGCGSAFWSMMCYRYYRSRFGDTGVQFTGLDIAPLAPGAHQTGRSWPNSSSSSSADTVTEGQPDRNMRWRFVQHDLRKSPWPLSDDEYDLVMVKDMSLATRTASQQACMDECLRVLAPGGIIEIWESDHAVRLLRPHVPEPAMAPSHTRPRTEQADGGDHHSDNSFGDQDDCKEAASLGAYVMTANTPLSAPANLFLVEYNGWLARALEARCLSAMPCTLIGPLLLQEAETLAGIGSRRLAVPLSEVRWEREGVGGVVTKNDGKSYIETKGGGLGGGPGGRPKGSPGRLGTAQAALRRTALVTVVHMVQSLEHVLRDVSGKSQDEWDGWLGKMTNDLLNENGTSWGECLEVGAWWARKRASRQSSS